MTRISKRTVDGLQSQNGRPTFLWDEQLPGFGVKALPSGAKKYLVKYRTQGGGRAAPQRWLTLGAHGSITPEQARQMAQQTLAAIARGEDPQGAKFARRASSTLSDVWTRFEAEHLPQKKPTTQVEYRSQWGSLIAEKLGKSRIEELSSGDVDRFHKSLRATPYRANRVLALLSRLMSLAETWGWRAAGTNPCKHIERFSESARTRFLSSGELKRLGETLFELQGDGTISATESNSIRLLLLTGARVNEIVFAQWNWINYESSILQLPDSKTGAKPIYLSEAASRVLAEQKALALDSELIFPARNSAKHSVNIRKAWGYVRTRSDLPEVRLHDLRHTAASIAVGQGASLPVIGRLLGHTQAQTTLRYAHVDIDPAMAAANEIGRVVSDAFSILLGDNPK